MATNRPRDWVTTDLGDWIATSFDDRVTTTFGDRVTIRSPNNSLLILARNKPLTQKTPLVQ